MKKQYFQLGDTAYLLDLDFKYYEERITVISFCNDGKTIVYETNEGFYFTKDEIGIEVFKDAESRETYLQQKQLL